MSDIRLPSLPQDTQNRILGDELREMLSEMRDSKARNRRIPPDLALARTQALAAIDRFEGEAAGILKARQADESAAVAYSRAAGIVSIFLPLIALILQLTGQDANWVTIAIGGATLVGIMNLLFGPGTRLLKISRERTQLLVAPHIFRQRILAAATFEELKVTAQEFQKFLASESALAESHS